MVWWITKYETGYGTDISGDRIFQSTNVIFSFHNKLYDAFGIYSLWSSGVNVFNVDRTLHDQDFLNDIKEAIIEAEKLYKPEYYRPIGLSVTMSVHEPVDIDERVDFIILKDVTKKEKLTEFKKRNISNESIPILILLTSLDLEDMNILIRFSDGLVLNLQHKDRLLGEYCPCPLKLCKEYYKPVFSWKPDVVRDFKSNDRRMLSACETVGWNHLDGVILVDCDKTEIPPEEPVRALVTAIQLYDKDIEPQKEYEDVSLKVKTPVTAPMSVALAASLVALKTGASAIMVLSKSGRSARLVVCACPPCHVLLITTKPSTARLHLYRKVMPLFYDQPRASNWQEECWNRVVFGTNFALRNGLLCSGAKLVVLAPSEEGTGYCNGFQIFSVPFRCNE